MQTEETFHSVLKKQDLSSKVKLCPYVETERRQNITFGGGMDL